METAQNIFFLFQGLLNKYLKAKKYLHLPVVHEETNRTAHCQAQVTECSSLTWKACRGRISQVMTKWRQENGTATVKHFSQPKHSEHSREILNTSIYLGFFNWYSFWNLFFYGVLVAKGKVSHFKEHINLLTS